MKIAIQGRDADTKVLRELLSPWDIQFTTSEREAEVVLFYEGKPVENRKTIIIPSMNRDFIALLKDLGLRASERKGRAISVGAGSQTVLTVVPRSHYCYEGPAKPSQDNMVPTAIALNNDLVLLSIDFPKECKNILCEAIDGERSPLFRLLTGLPVPYTLAPERLRNLVMRVNGDHEMIALNDKLSLDALRFILVRSIEQLTGTILARKRQSNKECICLLTHDVETREGLRRSRVLKKLEEKYGVPSSWYVPARHYELDLTIIEGLANHGEVGAHGNRHDGKLAELPRRKMVGELCQAKQTLENIIGQTVGGFRAPLLQCSSTLIHALCEAGYDYDTSMPTWEPNHPGVMKPFGIGTVNLLRINGIPEVPLTLPQDHQMLHVLNMTPKQTIKTWLRLMNVIRDIGGMCSILVHPDYELGDPRNLSIYEDLLNQVTSDKMNFITTPSQIIDEPT